MSALRSMAVVSDDHECEFKEQDCDICPACGEHTDFCEECGSTCCGAWPHAMD